MPKLTNKEKSILQAMVAAHHEGHTTSFVIVKAMTSPLRLCYYDNHTLPLPNATELDFERLASLGYIQLSRTSSGRDYRGQLTQEGIEAVKDDFPEPESVSPGQQIFLLNSKVENIAGRDVHQQQITVNAEALLEGLLAAVQESDIPEDRKRTLAEALWELRNDPALLQLASVVIGKAFENLR